MSQIQKDEWKYQPVFQKKAPNNIFIMKSQNLKMRVVKILGALIKLMNQNFSKLEVQILGVQI